MNANTQAAPGPDELADLVAHTTYRPGWDLELDDVLRGQGCGGLTLTITTDTVNSYPPHEPMRVRHLFPVPPAAYNRGSWARWLFECFHKVELHECMEFFTVAGEKVFAPNHGPGHDPYRVTQLTTDLDRRTSWRGEVNPARAAVDTGALGLPVPDVVRNVPGLSSDLEWEPER